MILNFKQVYLSSLVTKTLKTVTEVNAKAESAKYLNFNTVKYWNDFKT